MKHTFVLNKIIITCIGLFFGLTTIGQDRAWQHSPKQIRKMMKESRETDGLACMLITSTNDTIRGKKLDQKRDKKDKLFRVSMYSIDNKEIRVDSVEYYQDEDGFHHLLIMRTLDGKYFDNIDIARIIKGKADVYASNWNLRPGSNYIPGKGYDLNTSRWPQYQYWISGSISGASSITYNKLKERVSDHPAALAQFKQEFPRIDKPDERIKDFRKIEAVLTIYNQE